MHIKVINQLDGGSLFGLSEPPISRNDSCISKYNDTYNRWGHLSSSGVVLVCKNDPVTIQILVMLR